MVTTVTIRGQTVVPAQIRKAHNIAAKARLQWIDDGHTIRVLPVPHDPIQAAKGITRGLGDKLLQERERERRLD